MTSPSINLVVRNVNDRQLQRKILEVSAATGRTVKQETRTVFKGMVRDAIAITPPSSAAGQGKEAQRIGQKAIVRDMKRMGIVPVKIKGYRIITKAFGRPITPVRVQTRIPGTQLADQSALDTFHLGRMQSKHGGRVTRGRAQAYYTDKRLVTALRSRLFAEIGRLASGWIKAANQLGVPVPSWIARHGANARGTGVEIKETETRISMRVVNHFPDTAIVEAAEMLRRIAKIKEYAIGRLKRQLPYLLKTNLRAA